MTIQEYTANEADEDRRIAQAAVATERARQRAALAQREARALRRSAAGCEDMIEAVREVYASEPPIKEKVPKPQVQRGTVLRPILLLSDLHAGVIYDAHKMGGLGRFDETIFAEKDQPPGRGGAADHQGPARH
jgi:hypothetical protein